MEFHKSILSKLDFFIENGKIPNILFYGESGSGKKTIMDYFLDRIYDAIYEDDRDGDRVKNTREKNTREKNTKKNTRKIKEEYVMYVNCAHGKGIKFIRDELKFFAKTNINLTLKSSITNMPVPKSIILLNAEQLTIDAQSALRRCIELFSAHTRFFIITRHKEKLLKPIISRFCDIHVPRPRIRGRIVCLYDLKNQQPQQPQQPQQQPTIGPDTLSLSLSLNLNSTKIKNIKNAFKEIESSHSSHTNTIDKHHKDIFEVSIELYNKGISGLDLLNFIDTYLYDEFRIVEIVGTGPETGAMNDMNAMERKFMFLCHMNRAKYEIKNEKLFIQHILSLYQMRQTITLENLYTM
jgi:hypothetical protein